MQQQSRPDAVTRPDDPESRESQLIGTPPATSPDAAAAASPVTYAHAGAPEFFLAHGTEDRFVPVGQSEQLAEAACGRRPGDAAVGRGRRPHVAWQHRSRDILAESIAFARRATAAD